MYITIYPMHNQYNIIILNFDYDMMAAGLLLIFIFVVFQVLTNNCSHESNYIYYHIKLLQKSSRLIRAQYIVGLSSDFDKTSTNKT